MVDQDKFYLQSPSLFECLVVLPKDYELGTSYPLVIGLHGGGSTAARLATLWEDFEDHGFIYAVPQAQYPWFEDQGVVYDWALYPTGNVSLIEEATELAERCITNVMQAIRGRYEIEDVILLGFSQGAIIAYMVAIKNHHSIAGLVSFGGVGLLAALSSPFTGPFNPSWLSEEAIESARSLRVFIAHGKDDRVVEYDLGVQSRDVLEEYGYDVTMRTFQGGHRLPPKEILAEVIRWIDG